MKTLSTTLCGLTIALVMAPAAVAARTGGTSVGGASVGSEVSAPAVGGSSTTAPATPAVPVVHPAPVTARKPGKAYRGPVYQKTVTGQIVPYVAPLPAGRASSSTGGSPVGVTAATKPELLVPGATARIVNGLAAAPISAPAGVQQIIWTGNQIIGLPYIYGGGHASFTDVGYDCSGTVSYALHGASLLAAPADSSEFETWGDGGLGQWVTVFANAGHAYMTVAGVRLDTSAADDPSNQQGPRWRPLRQGNGGYTVRHPVGL